MVITLTKIANFYGDLEKIAKDFNPLCEELMDPKGISEKYGVYDCSEEPYLFIVSQDRIKLHLTQEYNTALTVTSDNPEKNSDIAEQFMKKSQIKFREPSKELSDMMQGVNLSFEVFKKYGQKAMDYLKERNSSCPQPQTKNLFTPQNKQ